MDQKEGRRLDPGKPAIFQFLLVLMTFFRPLDVAEQKDLQKSSRSGRFRNLSTCFVG